MDAHFLPDDRYLAAVGAVTIRWAYLEHAIDTAIHHLMEVDKTTGYAVTDEINSTPLRLAILKRLLTPRIMRSEDATTLNKYAESIRTTYAAKRNAAAHDVVTAGGLLGPMKSGRSTRKQGESLVMTNAAEV